MSEITTSVDEVELDVSVEEQALMRTCRTCHLKFLPSKNTNTSCIFHPEFFSGETAQRWMDPGDYKGGAIVHHFYSCCGNRDIKSIGCCQRRHMTFDEPEDVSFRKPGMGIH